MFTKLGLRDMRIPTNVDIRIPQSNIPLIVALVFSDL